MAKAIVFFGFCLINAVAAISAVAQQVAGSSEQIRPVVVLLEKGAKGTVYRVDGKDVTANPLRGIADAYQRHGAKNDYPVFAIVDDRLAIKMLGEAAGLIDR